MKVFILDAPGFELEQTISYLSGYRALSGVWAFSDYRELIRLAKEQDPEFCLIGLGRASVPGFKTARLLQQVSPEIKIIFISDERKSAVEAFEIGARGYLLRPIKKEKLDELFGR